jgi:hypothetical protein
VIGERPEDAPDSRFAESLVAATASELKSFAYEVRAEPDAVLRSLGASIAPETSSNVQYVDEVDTELVGLTEGPGRVSVRRRRSLFSGFSGAVRLDVVVSKSEGGSRVVGRYRLGSLALMVRSVYVVFFIACGTVVTALAISRGGGLLVGGIVAVIFVLTQVPLEYSAYFDRQVLRAEVERALLRAGPFLAESSSAAPP